MVSAVQQITRSATRKAIEAKLSSSSSQLSSKQNTERLKEDEPRPPLKKRTKAMPSQPLNTKAEETISRPFKLLKAEAHLVLLPCGPFVNILSHQSPEPFRNLCCSILAQQPELPPKLESVWFYFVLMGCLKGLGTSYGV
ncbi:hypothetical protein PSTG_00252 [Puccinia striiformis f. sp. tritici PST-78]|uniref:Uncharacterized protein n=1 Tax=Puccinia striiformis f. sp. tritici PST-78 TaxID=1165861 RepID=A0A0L0W4E1_9BASI|nr:hypothetical protein PSTG_00252 [Puccinia striiformis f. sp. tritici PST-78]